MQPLTKKLLGMNGYYYNISIIAIVLLITFILSYLYIKKHMKHRDLALWKSTKNFFIISLIPIIFMFVFLWHTFTRINFGFSDLLSDIPRSAGYFLVSVALFAAFLKYKKKSTFNWIQVFIKALAIGIFLSVISFTLLFFIREALLKMDPAYNALLERLATIQQQSQ